MPTLVCTSVRTLIKVAAKRMTSYTHVNVRRQMWVLLTNNIIDFIHIIHFHIQKTFIYIR